MHYLVFAACDAALVGIWTRHRRRADEDPRRSVDAFRRGIDALGTPLKIAKRR